MGRLDSSSQGYLQGRPFKAIDQIINVGEPLVFDSVESGSYAISVFFDENSSGLLDTNLVGMPDERYGFSNNARGIFGPPSFTEANFVVGSEDIIQVITLK